MAGGDTLSVDAALRRDRDRRLRVPAIRFLLPAVVLFGVLYALPTLGAVPLSFTNWNGIGNLAFVGAENFLAIGQSGAFVHALWHNVIFFAAFFVLVNVVAMGLALLLNLQPLGYQVYRTLIFLPAILSLIATGFIWSELLNPQIGVINPMLKGIGLGVLQSQWISSPRFALATVIAVSWWQWGGVPMVVYGAGLKAIPLDLLEAANVDGARAIARFRHIMLPLLRPAVIVNTVLTFVAAFQSFAVIFVLEGVTGAPAGATDVVGTLIYRTAFGSGGAFSSTQNLGAAEANAIVVMVILAAALGLLQLYFRRRIVEY